MDNINKCPICQKNSRSKSYGQLDGFFEYDCEICGSFKITEEAIDYVKDPKINRNRFKFSAYLKERYIKKKEKVLIVSSNKNIDKRRGAIVGVDDILNTSFPNTISERLDRALINLQHLSSFPGEYIKLNLKEDYPIFFAENENACIFIKKTLEDTGFIKSNDPIHSKNEIFLTAKGWNKIAEIELEIRGKDSNQAFIAMSFNKDLHKFYSEGFKKAIKSAGYDPKRMDLKEHNNKICDDIIAEIRKSRFLVADFTDHKGGVYFEAGYALGLGLPVIWTCKDDDKNNLHFDTRQYNHIFWSNEKDLYDKLLRRIEATI